MINVGVVLAGGSGIRMGGPQPKQFLPLGSKLVIEYSIDTFCHHPMIDEVVVVVSASRVDEVRQMCASRPKVRHVVAGGAERHLSSLAAIGLYRGRTDVNLLLHDAARPLMDAALLSRVLEALRHHEAVSVAIAATDTVYVVQGDTVQSIPPRHTLRLAQTPQAFRLPVLEAAYAQGLLDPTFATTDDCGVVLRYQPAVAIHVVEGDGRNFKLTRQEDMRRAETEIQSQYA